MAFTTARAFCKLSFGSLQKRFGTCCKYRVLGRDFRYCKRCTDLRQGLEKKMAHQLFNTLIQKTLWVFNGVDTVGNVYGIRTGVVNGLKVERASKCFCNGIYRTY